jgi:hypothetical protein
MIADFSSLEDSKRVGEELSKIEDPIDCPHTQCRSLP